MKNGHLHKCQKGGTWTSQSLIDWQGNELTCCSTFTSHVFSFVCCFFRVYFPIACDEVAEWLRRWTANPLCSARVGSNPILVEYCKFSKALDVKSTFTQMSKGRNKNEPVTLRLARMLQYFYKPCFLICLLFFQSVFSYSMWRGGRVVKAMDC